MRKIFILVLSVLAFGMVNAQKLDDIKLAVFQKQYEKAKPLLDAFLANPKNEKNAEAWYYKGFVYTALGSDTSFAKVCDASCRFKAMDAFQKYISLDPKGALLTDEGNISTVIIYDNAYTKGINLYNAKNYGEAFKEFELAQQMQQFMWKNKQIYTPKDGVPFPTSALDTNCVLNLGAAAELNKDVDNALKYYQLIADAGIGGKTNQIIYEYLASNYQQRGNNAAFQSVIAKAQQLYPEADYFVAVELEGLPKDASKETLYAKYEELCAKYPNRYFLQYNYAVDMFQQLYQGDSKNMPNREQLKDKLSAQIIKAIAVDKTADANVLMVLHLDESSYELKDEINKIKGTKPEDQKKRNALKEAAKKKLESAEPYADAAIAFYATQKELQVKAKNNYKKMYDIKRDIAKGKGDQKKMIEIEKKLEAISKM